jgi:regulator of protease activity HflC (stomatin/prohibitin superfamily)
MSILLILFVILGIITFLASVKIIAQYEKGVVLRLGKLRGLAEPGLNIVLPYIETVIKIDMRERVINVEPQKVITKDNVTVIVDAVIYYKVVDPVKAEFEVEDFGTAATTLAQTNLRNVVGDKTLDETLTARDVINTSLREVLDEATHNWGVKVTRVEVQKIDPPGDIAEAMALQMTAERRKRAAVLTAEGERQSDILQAEGEKQASILRAEGEAKAIQMVAEAANKYFDKNAQVLKHYEVTSKVLENNAKVIVVPAGSDIINVIGGGQDGQVIPLKR